jgi:hypothetical protein
MSALAPLLGASDRIETFVVCGFSRLNRNAPRHCAASNNAGGAYLVAMIGAKKIACG